MKPRSAKRERQGEQLGRGLGVVGPFRDRREEWLEAVERRVQDRIEQREHFQDIVKAWRGVPHEEWPFGVWAAFLWLLDNLPDD